MKRIMKKAVFYLLLLLWVIPAHAQKSTSSESTSSKSTFSKVLLEEMDAAALEAAIESGARYLARATKPSGDFVYLDNLQPGHSYRPVYNVLRHAGTMYALADYCLAYPDADPEIKAALGRAAHWLQTKYIAPVEDVEGVLAIWSLPSDRGGDGPREIKLGGIGLGLVGLLQTEKVLPGTTRLEVLRKLGEGILWLQKPEGNFYSKYDPLKGGKLDDWVSLYYPGEAALGLAMLAEHETDIALKRRWSNGAAHAIGYLARSRENEKNIPADHWALIASARLWMLQDGDSAMVSREEILRHAVQICETILRDRALRGFYTTPIATRLEGMLAALTFLPPKEEKLRAAMEEEIERGVLFLMKAQATEGHLKGALPRASKVLLGGTQSTFEDRRADEVRIDYTQHALSAWLEYRRQKQSSKKQP